MDLINLIIAVAVGAVAGYGLRYFLTKNKVDTAEKKADRIIQDAKQKKKDAENEAKEKLLNAKEKIADAKEKLQEEAEEKNQELVDYEKELLQKDEDLNEREEELTEREKQIEEDLEALEDAKERIREIKEKQADKLEEIAKLSKEEAKDQIINRVEKEYEEEIMKKVHQLEERLEEEKEEKAKDIISSAMQRYAADVATENTTRAVELPNDDMKGRVIGKNGRNIDAFERVTGVDLVVDDTPEMVMVSTFDPVRREIAVRTLEKLVEDGRIQPARIEETHKKTKKEINKQIKKAGEEALVELGLSGLPSELVNLIGTLKYRTSYGQNVLQHSIESAHIARILAEEIGADTEMAKLAALLHDIGKALDHNFEGSHTELSKKIAVKYDLPEPVAHALEVSHEGAGGPSQPIDFITMASDAISAARPGARRETAEQFVKRLEKLENIAGDYEGVDRSFAIQAGRQVRVMVVPEEVSDLEAVKLAKEIAGHIEDEMTYPGQVKVNVIRETRAEAIAK